MRDYDTLNIFWEYDAIQDLGEEGCLYHLMKGTKKQGIWYECDSWVLWKDGRGYIKYCYDVGNGRKNDNVWSIRKGGIIGGRLVDLGNFCDGGYGKKEYIDWLLGE